MSKWLCTDCAWHPSPGRRNHCPLCCGYNTPEQTARKRKAPKPARTGGTLGEGVTSVLVELRQAAA
jgi:hypothetical protein